MFTTKVRQSEANPQSFNRYSYVQNDPVNFVDPSGLDMWSGGSGYGCDASYGSCGGGFDWGGGGGGGGGGFGFSGGLFDSGRFGPGSAAEAAYEQRLQNTRDGIAARNAWNNENYSLVADILNRNPNVGLSVGGAQLWGELGAAFANGYGERVEIASLGFAGLGSRLERGWRATANFLKSLRASDFIIVNVTAGAGSVGFSMSRAIPRGDSLYEALTNPMKGAGIGTGAEISFAFGWILQLSQPSHSEVESWLSGQSLTVSGFYKVGGGIIYAPNSTPRWGVIGGFGVGGKGAGASYTTR